MVKNTKGGSGHKGQARKYTTNASGASKTRFAEDEGEIYAQVTAVLGNGMCHVICADNKKSLCLIRGKFRGRGKNDNILSMNKWVLIGIREFESEKTGIGKDLDRCDLLEVYSDLDKDRLKSRETTINWNLFIANDFANASGKSKDNEIEFREDDEAEYKKLVEKDLSGEAPKNIVLSKTGEFDLVDFSDI